MGFHATRQAAHSALSLALHLHPAHPVQVSKTAPTGEYLVTGSFMIRGRKNYLPPQVGAGHGCMRASFVWAQLWALPEVDSVWAQRGPAGQFWIQL